MKQVAVPLVVCLLAACGPRGPARPAKVPVTVARAEQQALPYEIAATGTVEPLQTAAIESQVTGILTRVTFHEGDDVQAGQLLFEIDPRPFQAALDQARGMLARDVAQLASAQADAERYAQLVKQDYVTKSDYEQKRATADALVATVRADSGAVTNAQLNLEWARIRAPIAGRTGRLLVRAGNLVRANSDDPLVVINQIHPILVRFAVPEGQLADVQRFGGNHLPVLASPSKSDTAPATGVLTFIDNAVDTATGTVLLKAQFSNGNNALWPGEYLNVRLRLYTEDSALVVPAQAVMQGQQGSYLFVVNRDGTARSQPVAIERTTETYAVLVRNGAVHPGDEVVTDGQIRLTSGTPVQVTGTTGTEGGTGTADGPQAVR
ncbi:MAG TPA: efflux RND transporter periplasmic adaptor subunit [Gemmatimonadales bacterium]|nr:efflux RND transporter periplasmic adaptor subunit [Gemmatimonadales bacterium]